jgi:hypothetical protein
MEKSTALYLTDCSEVGDSITTFVCEENKKSSFALSRIAVLQVQSSLSSSNTAPADESSSSFATASISHRASDNESSRNEIFLFGGFELITNVNSLQVYVTRSDKGEEYLTSCKGIRARDLPHLENDQTIQIEDLNAIDWFKFVFASPGGAKPVSCVRLEFRFTGSNNSPSVIARSMKVKCRLNGNESRTSMKSQLSHNTTGMSFLQHPTQGMGSINNLTSMMAMVQGGGPMTISAQQPIVELAGQQVTTGTESIHSLQSMTAMISNARTTMAAAQNTNSSFPQQAQQKIDKNHVEMMSSIAGLGMFLKSSEEKTMKRLETMLSQMEARLSKQLDNLSCRLDTIEQHLSSADITNKRADCDNALLYDKKNQNNFAEEEAMDASGDLIQPQQVQHDKKVSDDNGCDNTNAHSKYSIAKGDTLSQSI